MHWHGPLLAVAYFVCAYCMHVSSTIIIFKTTRIQNMHTQLHTIQAITHKFHPPTAQGGSRNNSIMYWINSFCFSFFLKVCKYMEHKQNCVVIANDPKCSELGWVCVPPPPPPPMVAETYGAWGKEASAIISAVAS